MVDDSSKDNSVEILKRISNPLVKVIVNKKNVGAIEAVNIGIKNTRGDYFVLLDGDDKVEPTYLEKTMQKVKSSTGVDFVYTDYFEAKTNGQISVVRTDNLFNILAGGVLFNKKSFLEVGGFDGKVLLAEYDLLLRTLHIWRGERIPEPLFWYQRNETSITKRSGWISKALRQLKEQHPDKLREISLIRKY